jgi:hypothetical protein
VRGRLTQEWRDIYVSQGLSAFGVGVIRCVVIFKLLGTSKNSFLLRTAAIFSGGVIRTKLALDVALATPAAILPFCLAGKNFARSHDKSNF